MALSRYRKEIVAGANILTDVARGIEAAKADDGKVDAGEAFQIFFTAILSGLFAAAGISGGRDD